MRHLARLLLITLAGASVLSCKGKAVSSAGLFLPRIVLPTATNQPNLQVTGVRSPDTKVWIHYRRDENATLLVDASASAEWTANLDLREGENTFTFFATDAAEVQFSATEEHTVLLDSIAPNQLTIDAALVNNPGVLLGQTEDSGTVEIQGTKDADANLTITLPSGELRVIEIDGATTWGPLTFAVSRGSNVFTFQSADSLGNVTSLVTLDIFASSLSAPAVDSGVCQTTLDPRICRYTQQASVSITGTKSLGTGIRIVDGSAAEVFNQSANSTGTWAATLTLAEGTNNFRVFAFDTADSIPLALVFIKDNTAPAAPTINLPTSLTEGLAEGALALTGNPTVTINGVKDADGNVCVRKGSEGTCTEAVPVDGNTTYSVEVVMTDGLNQICVSSQDFAGNLSAAENCVNLNKVPSPTVTIQDPAAGELVTGQFTMSAQVTTGTLFPTQEALTSVQFCVNDTCSNATLTNGSDDNYTGTVSTASLSNGDVLRLSVVATNAGGASTTSSIDVVFSSGDAVAVSNNSTPADSVEVAVAASGTVLHVVWSDNCTQFSCDVTGGSTPNDIFYRKYEGGSFGDIQAVSAAGSESDGNSRTPAVAVDSNGNIHVVWSDSGNVGSSGNDNDILHRIIDGTSGTLGDITVVNTSSTVDDTEPALVADASGGVHLAYVSELVSDRGEVMYTSWNSTDGWATPVNMSDHSNDFSVTSPDIDIDSDGTVHVVWQGLDRGTANEGDFCRDASNSNAAKDDFDVFYRSRTSGGTITPALSNPTFDPVSNDAFDDTFCRASLSPAVAVVVSNNTIEVHVVWSDDRKANGDDFDIYRTRYAAHTALGTYELISQSDTMDSTVPAVSARGDTLAVAWTQDVDGTDSDLAYILAGNATVQRPANNTGVSTTPAVLIDSVNNLHMFWQDGTMADANDAELSGGGVDQDIFYLGVPLD